MEWPSPVIGCTAFWLFGFAIAWSEGNCIVGWHHFAFANLPGHRYSQAFHQLIFANTASTLVNGALAERLSLSSYFVHPVLLTGSSNSLIIDLKLTIGQFPRITTILQIK